MGTTQNSQLIGSRLLFTAKPDPLQSTTACNAMSVSFGGVMPNKLRWSLVLDL